MAQLSSCRSVSSIPVPTPCETFSFLEADDNFLAVTPDKTLSNRFKPITELLKEGSFLADNDKCTQSRVQFNRSVSVFHFSPDQTFTGDEISQDSVQLYKEISHLDVSNFDSSVIHEVPRADHYLEVGFGNLMKKSCRLEVREEQDLSVSSRITTGLKFDCVNHEKKYLQTDEYSDDKSPRKSANSANELTDSVIITDIHSYDDEHTWEEDDDDDDDETTQPDQVFDKLSIKETLPRRLTGLQKSDDVSATKIELTDSTKFIKQTFISQASIISGGHLHETSKDSKTNTAATKCPDNKINRGQVLVRPVLNTTLKYSLDVEKLRRRSFEKEVLKNGRLKDEKMIAKIKSKALSKLNMADDNLHFTDLISINIDEEEVCRKVVEEKLSKVRREKAAKIEDKITRRPDIMDFYNESYFVLEPSCLPPDYSNFGPIRSRFKTAPADKATDLYKHQRMWEGLP